MLIVYLNGLKRRTLALYVKRRGLRKKYVHMILKLLNLTWMQSMFVRRKFDQPSFDGVSVFRNVQLCNALNNDENADTGH
mmetsp:Transcript_1894/g.4128  ORF Transcript_1894/g.4128 Transcript_1894/m.4128 type:complete len:80 (-) Transcript_1894:48-287(-)